jgi:hypothetical protein
VFSLPALTGGNVGGGGVGGDGGGECSGSSRILAKCFQMGAISPAKSCGYLAYFNLLLGKDMLALSFFLIPYFLPIITIFAQKGINRFKIEERLWCIVADEEIKK